jgi:hypothetical protein
MHRNRMIYALQINFSLGEARPPACGDGIESRAQNRWDRDRNQRRQSSGIYEPSSHTVSASTSERRYALTQSSSAETLCLRRD